MANRWHAAMVAGAAVAMLAASGCDTRPTCDVVCDNEVRCSFVDEGSCPGMCALRVTSASSDCQLATDAYHRCWSAQGTCPASRTAPVAGCSAEHSRMSLACVSASPLTRDDDGI